MSYKPILFSTPMVQAILQGRKTMTRRVQGLELINESPDAWKFLYLDKNVGVVIDRPDGEYKEVTYPMGATFEFIGNDDTWNGCDNLVCKPKFLPGDILWVRENFKVQQVDRIHEGEWKKHVCIDFVASEGGKTDDFRKWFYIPEKNCPKVLRRKEKNGFATISPNIFLPKECARIFLKVTGVKVERLCDISEEDAEAEGAHFWSQEVALGNNHLEGLWCRGSVVIAEQRKQKRPHSATTLGAFYAVWKFINGEDSWNSNPWVFVYQFERLPAGEAGTDRPTDFFSPAVSSANRHIGTSTN